MQLALLPALLPLPLLPRRRPRRRHRQRPLVLRLPWSGTEACC
jgi:hypothetical protein